MRYNGKMRQSQTGHRYLYNTAHAPWMLDKKGYRQTIRIRNNYCFYTATVVTRKDLNITLNIQYIAVLVYVM